MTKLLKKDVPYIWDKTLQDEFEAIKEILRSPIGLKPYNRDWDTFVYSDYSSKGLGYVLCQENPKDRRQKHIVHMGSVPLNPRQQDLPAIYGKNLGIVVALEKLRYWLRGCPRFTVRTDQAALAQIYNAKRLRK